MISNSSLLRRGPGGCSSRMVNMSYGTSPSPLHKGEIYTIKILKINKITNISPYYISPVFIPHSMPSETRLRQVLSL